MSVGMVGFVTDVVVGVAVVGIGFVVAAWVRGGGGGVRGLKVERLYEF